MGWFLAAIAIFIGFSIGAAQPGPTSQTPDPSGVPLPSAQVAPNPGFMSRSCPADLDKPPAPDVKGRILAIPVYPEAC